jgi:hypothetical protein
MKVINKVTASSQVDATLPLWIRSPDIVIQGDGISSYSQENHRNFVSFMTTSGESQERVGFGQDLLQNLLKYSDFDFYKNPIISYGILTIDGITGFNSIEDRPILEGGENPLLAATPEGDAAQVMAGYKVDKDLLMLDKNEVDELELVDGYGFPDENGVLLIDDEVILYRRKEGNKFYELRRGSSAVTVLPSYREEGKYLSKTEAVSHYAGSVVYNLSVLSLMSILDTIHNTYTHNITRDRVASEVNRATILKHIKDFFRSKGSKLGIKALFKILFAENDVDVFYPGDRMITPSKSTWAEGLIVRTVPVPFAFCDPEEKYTTPENTIGSSLVFKSYSATIINDKGIEQTFMPDDEFARSFVDYAVSYQVESETQYEMYVNENSLQGKVVTNPRSKLTRPVNSNAVGVDKSKDYTVITVESTLGFPNEGVVFIDNEAIYYRKKTPNQFLDCQRGHIGVISAHRIGSYIYGPYYIETRIVDDEGVEHVSRSWPLGLVEDLDIKDPGLLHTIDDKVTTAGPGRTDPSDPLLCVVNYVSVKDEIRFTFLENYDDELVQQKTNNSEIVTYVGDRTHGPDGIFFDDKYGFVSSSGFPSYPIGPFTSTNAPVDQFVGPLLEPDHTLAVIPRKPLLQDNPFTHKGTDLIGVFVDGVRAYSQTSSEHVTQGRVSRIDVDNPGEGYINPTVVITPQLSATEVVVAENTGSIQSIEVTSDAVYTSVPRVRITSGEDAKILADFDRYGRIISVTITSAGRYYNDVPTIKAIDKTGKGKGALFSCEVNQGEIVNVNILNSGIDYDRALTEISIIPIGSGATATATVEYYEINRYIEVISNQYWNFDDGNGFIYQKPVGIDRNYYGYVCSPTKLRDHYDDDGSKHSPLLGFAFDGNPIYGPYAYTNNTDDSQGVVRQLSAYVLRQSRNNIIAAGGSNKPGLAPPSTLDYPLGYFNQDYQYAPGIIKDELDPDRVLEGYLATEDPEYIHSSRSEYLEIDDGTDGIGIENPLFRRILNRNNGKICNTPEYPKELYPDGVFCYFTTINENDQPAFPYIIGETFNNRPISQNIDVVSQVSIGPLPKQTVYSSVIVDETNLAFDFTRVERLRNPYLSSTDDEVKIKIGEVSEGSIDDVFIQIALPSESAIGDSLYFDNSQTTGAGSHAMVSFIEGVRISSAIGDSVSASIQSHNIVLRGINPTPTLVETDVFYSGDSLNRVTRYVDTDQIIGRILAQTITKELPNPGDISYDMKRNPFEFDEVIVLPESRNQNILWVDKPQLFKMFDKADIENGYQYPLLDTHEDVVIEKVYPDGRIKVRRPINSRAIPDQTPITLQGKYLYRVVCSTKHMINIGDTVKFENSIHDEINGSHKVIDIDDTGFEFSVYTTELYDEGDDIDLTYMTNSPRVIGKPADIKIVSGGYGYSSLPKVVGTYHRITERAETKIVMSNSKITKVEVISGGSRYVSPVAHIVDRDGFGSGARADVVLESGKVKEINITNSGTGYKNPYLYLLETDGKFICTTRNIGKIKSFRILNPGRNISSDRSLKPEIKIDTRCIVKFDESQFQDTDTNPNNILEPTRPDENFLVLSIDVNRIQSELNTVMSLTTSTINTRGIKELYTPIYNSGEIVYQGIETNITSIGEVIEYDDDRQLLTMKDVSGPIEEGKDLISRDTYSEVIREGQSDCRIIVNGSAKPEGKFIDDTSKLSEWYAVVQDSYRYQWFSYVIASPIQQIDYETFVKEIIHPAGFIQFADLTIHSSVKTRIGVGERDLITLFVDPCSPLKLLAADGTPIIAATENGDKFILAKNEHCVIPPVDIEGCALGITLNGLTNSFLEIVNENGESSILEMPCPGVPTLDEDFTLAVSRPGLDDDIFDVVDSQGNSNGLRVSYSDDISNDNLNTVDNDTPISLNI